MFISYGRFIFIVSSVIFVFLNATYDTQNPLLYINLESQYPSYVSTSEYGLCLRAREALEPETIVGTATMVASKLPYIHGHHTVAQRHAGIIGFRKNKPLYGRVLGKYAFCNHSCTPNCRVTPNFFIKTTQPIAKDEELTLAYDAYIQHMPWQQAWSFSCFCKTNFCKKQIKRYRSDITHPATYHNY